MTPLQQAASELIDRWNTPLWKDVPNTGNYICTLNSALMLELNQSQETQQDDEDIVHRLNKRAEIRRSIKDRKSVQEGKPDRIADLLEEAAIEIIKLRGRNNEN